MGEPDWNVLIALIIAVAIGIRLAGIPRWFKQRGEKLTEFKEAYPNITFWMLLPILLLIAVSELGVYALSFYFIDYLIN